jgi:hypothetical protein
MRTLPIDASDGEIKALVVEWSELLAEKRYREALEMFSHCDWEINWTPEALQQVIAGYGVIGPDDDTLGYMLEIHGVPRFEITTLRGRTDYNEILETRIEVDREDSFGLDPARYLGMVHYHDVPLSGFRSDLTARFYILRVGPDRLTLEFLDLHVM